MFDLATQLDGFRDAVLAQAGEALACARLQHYGASSPEENTRRLYDLYGALEASVGGRTILPMTRHAEAIARERHRGGFDLSEVLCAFNVLEEALWRRMASELPVEAYPQAFGLIGTVLGAGKQALALQYVTLARQTGAPALDVDALFAGG